MTDFAARRMTMVDTQVRPNDVTKYNVIEAMLSIPREDFVPADMREAAYVSENVSLGEDRVLLEPRTLGKMLDILDIQKDEFVLDVATGFGYSAAVISQLAEAVVAVEEDEAMAAEAQTALTDAEADNVVLHTGTLTEGAAEHAPYDVILLQGAVAQMSDAILDQLKEGGRIAALFVEGALGVVRIGYKVDGKMTWRHAFNAGAPVLPGFAREPEFSL